MPETPIETDTAVHPFDLTELDTIVAVCGAELPGGEPLLTLSYARAVMPAMAEKIRQLRGLLGDARQETLIEVLARMQSIGDGAGLNNPNYVQGWRDAERTVNRMRESP